MSQLSPALRILVVEDEFMVRLMIEDMLQSLNCEVVATASSLKEGVALSGSTQIDVAVLDVNLHGETVYPVAEILRSRRIPIVFSTGYGAAGLHEAWRAYPILQKPYDAVQLRQALAQALA